MIEQLIDKIVENNPLHRNFIESAIENVTTEEKKQLNLYLQYCFSKGLTLEFLTDCYLTIVEDTFREQIYFIKHRRYRYSTFAEVAEHVYFNKTYMLKYMYGLALTSFLWPNHLGIARFYRDCLPKNKHGQLLEIGPGHGYYLMTAINESNFDNICGVDISETSIELTKDIIDYYCQSTDRLTLICDDFLNTDQLRTKSYDAIIMGEVLEHVEQPKLFLQRITDLSKEDAFIFISTCINAPAVDHIFLWDNLAELEAMITDSGLQIKAKTENINIKQTHK